MRLYLAHASVDRHRVREIELRLEKELGIDLRNPFYDKEHVNIRRVDSGEIVRNSQQDADRIVADDLEFIDSCDGLLAIFGKEPQPWIGMPMEVFYNSHVLRHPTYIVIENERFRNHPWLMKYATRTFDSIEGFSEWYRARDTSKTKSM